MALLSALAKARDELVKLGYPEEVAENIVSGRLDMRTDAIVERQQDLFPTTAFHGGGDDIRVVDPNRITRGKTANTGFFMSDSPVVAASYADRSGNIMPLAVDARGFDVVNAGSNEWNRIVNPDYLLGGDRLAKFGDLPGYRGTLDSDRGIFDLNVVRNFDTDELARTARRFGSPGLIVKNVQDIGPNYKAFDPAFEAMTGLKIGDEGYQQALDQFSADTIVASDPTRIRSLFAAFDPEYKGSNILGDRAIPVAGAGLLAAAALAPEEAEAGVIKAFGREFDPRFDPRAKEQERLRNATFAIEDRGTQDMPRLALSSLEGRPFVTTQSDRTQAGGLLTRINDVDLNVPVDLRGGQGFMFENPAAWASGGNVITSLMKARDEFPGENPLILPYRMTPTGGDFATMTGETMIGYASANMTSKTKKQLDKQIKELIPEWKGVDNPESIKQFQNAKTNVRKYIQQQVMDVNFRNEGGLSIGEARLAVTDPKQAQAGDLQIQNIGEIFAGARTPSDHPAYPFNLPGQGLGYTDQEVNIFELMPEARVGADQRLVADPQRPTRSDARALEMKPYTGRITDDILRGLEARGVNVNANPMVTAAAVAAGQEAEGLLAQLPQKDSEAYNYSDVLPIKRSKDPEEREGLLGGYSPAYTGVVEDMIEGLLKFSTQAKRGIYNPAAASEFLL